MERNLTDIFNQVFIDSERRSLVRRFVNLASRVENVRSIVAVGVRDECGTTLPMLYVLTCEDFVPRNSDDLNRVYLKVCPDEYNQGLLSHVAVMHESDFFGADTAKKYQMVRILFDRQASPTIAVARLNSTLN